MLHVVSDMREQSSQVLNAYLASSQKAVHHHLPIPTQVVAAFASIHFGTLQEPIASSFYSPRLPLTIKHKTYLCHGAYQPWHMTKQDC